MNTPRLTMQEALALVDELRHRLLLLEGQDLNAEVPNHKTLMAAKARVNADLIYTAHLARLVEVEVLNQYHRFKGVEDVPRVIRH